MAQTMKLRFMDSGLGRSYFFKSAGEARRVVVGPSV